MDILLFTASVVATRYLAIAKTSPTPTYALLKKQNAETSNAIIDYYKNHEAFGNLAQYEGDLTVTRDTEDGEKLQAGIDFAKKKGVIDPNFEPEPYVTIDVLGKTPEEVAQTILSHVQSGSNTRGGSSQGSVIVLVGLSGTGKGTTVAKLRQYLEKDGKKVVSWSNGNIFRSLTYLAATWCEQKPNIKTGFDENKAMTKENLHSFMGMLSFGKFANGGTEYDTRICGMGVDMLVSEVQNTELKSPKVSKNIPTVAGYTQGEVILFAANAVEMMKKDGIFVLFEGREQTVNYVRTPHRFALVLSDESLIGKRRAAQRLMAAALDQLPDEDSDSTVVIDALNSSLASMLKEIECEHDLSLH